MIVAAKPPAPRDPRRRRWLGACLTALIVAVTACAGDDDGASDATPSPDTSSADTPSSDTTIPDTPSSDTSIEYRDERGPYVDAPDRAMAMTVDAIDVAGDDILVRVRVANSDDHYLDLGVQDTIYGPLLVMRDDNGNVYDGLAVEPAGIPGHRLANLSFRLAGPLDRDAASFTLELATQRGSLTSPEAPLPQADGVRWRVDDPADSTPTSIESQPADTEPGFAAAPRLPDLVHFWLETEPLAADG